MVISVLHGGDPIPKSPFNISVAPQLDLTKVKVEGLDTSKYKILHSSFYLELLNEETHSELQQLRIH